MSREEAATVYLDNLLGFSGSYQKYMEAERSLTKKEKELLQAAVTGWARDDRPHEKVCKARAVEQQ